MKRILYNSPYTQKKLEKKPKIFVVTFRANYGVVEYPWSGKIAFNPATHRYEPIVWKHIKLQDAFDEYHQVFLSEALTGNFVAFFFDMGDAARLCSQLRMLHDSILLKK